MAKHRTSFFHRFFNAFCPPVLRDNRAFMRLFGRMVLPKETVELLADYKRNALFWSDAQIADFYAGRPSNPHYTTDITDEGVEYILNAVDALPPNASILDIACGSGYLAHLISKKRRHVTGIDFAAPHEKYRNEYVTFLKGDITNIPVPNDTYDLVISAHTLEHVVDIQKAISELRRVAKKLLLIIVPCQKEYRYMFDSHIHFFPFCESFQRIMGGNNEKAQCFMLGDDIAYKEEI